MIELVDVTTRFDTTTALEGISLEIEPGESLALIGPNGAGKTTILKILGGLLMPSAGEVRFDGDLARGEVLEKLRLHATMVFQKPVLFGTTVYKNVAYGLRVRGLPENQVSERVLDALGLVQMEDFADRQARNLSGGEQKRVNLAMAIAIDPQILLLDEPTSYLDALGTKIVEGFIQRIREERQTTVVIATHDLFQAVRLTERAAVLEGGQLCQVGPSSQIIREEVEALIFSDQECNVFHGIAKNGTSEGERHLTKIELGEAVTIEALTDTTGEVTVRISPEDIIVSREPVLSSAKNTLRGVIRAIDVDDSIVRLTVDVGIDLVAIITKSSLNLLSMAVGDRVYVTFKASSVRVY